MTNNAKGLKSMKTEYWPHIFIGTSNGRFERNCSRTPQGKKLERRLIPDIFSATECLPTKYHKLRLDHFANEYINLTNNFTLNFALPFLYQTSAFTILHVAFTIIVSRNLFKNTPYGLVGKITFSYILQMSVFCLAKSD